MRIHIGTSGWSYEHWNGVLYPYESKPWDRLKYYEDKYDTVELNISFYRWPTVAAFKSWQHKLPHDFLLSVKAPRYLTHTKRLYEPEKWIEKIKPCWHALADKRAVLLVQLSPNFTFDYERLHYFLQYVPSWMKMSLEFRHSSWHQEPVFDLLERYGVAYCIMSGAHLPCIVRTTAPFVYVRMHGPDHQQLYGGSYTDTDLQWWAQHIREWERLGKQVFVYFNNDGEGNAVRNANALKYLLGVPNFNIKNNN